MRAVRCSLGELARGRRPRDKAKLDLAAISFGVGSYSASTRTGLDPD
jgi:hypothetical protein